MSSAVRSAPRARRSKPTPRRAAASSGRVAAQRLVRFARSDVAWFLLGVCGAAIGPVVLALGWDYYRLAPELRPGHRWDDLLAPGRGLGLVMGVAAISLFLLNLTYILRRRFGLLHQVATVRTWLNLHFVCGVTGASLVLAHSALRTQNLIALIAGCAIVVAIGSGIFGRYILVHLPRRADGQTANPAELATLLAQLRLDLERKLRGYPRLQAQARAALGDALSPLPRRGLLALPGLVLADLRLVGRRRRTVQLRDALERAALDEDDGEALRPLVDEAVELVALHGSVERRLSQHGAVQDIMDTWRAMHLIMALVLTTATAVHITIALTYSRIALFG